MGNNKSSRTARRGPRTKRRVAVAYKGAPKSRIRADANHGNAAAPDEPRDKGRIGYAAPSFVEEGGTLTETLPLEETWKRTKSPP